MTINWTTQNIHLEGDELEDVASGNWTLTFNPDRTMAYALCGVLGVGFISYDKGQTWSYPPFIISSLALGSALSSNYLYVAERTMLARYDLVTGEKTDVGAETIPIGSISGKYISNVACDSSGNKILMVCTSPANVGYISYSENGGENWTTIFGSSVVYSSNSIYEVYINSDGSNLYCSYQEKDSPFDWVLYSKSGGGSWTKIDTSPSTAHRYLWGLFSESGQYLALLNIQAYTQSADQNIYISSDYGATWDTILINPYIGGRDHTFYNKAFRGTVTMSKDGSGILINVAGDYFTSRPNKFYYSSDYGNTWTNPTMGTDIIISELVFFRGMSYLGDSTSEILLSTYYDLWNTDSAGSSWEWENNTVDYSGAPLVTDWNVAMAKQSQYFIAANADSGYVYQRTPSSGNAYTKLNVAGSSVALEWNDVCINDNGRYILCSAVDEGLYVSSDYGESWEEPVIPDDEETTGTYQALSISSTGQYVLTSDYYYENSFYSNDFGSSWNKITTTEYLYDDSAISENGDIMAFVGSALLMSTNYGVSWSKKYDDYLSSVCMNNDGSIIYILDSDTKLFKSIDYGDSWAEIYDFTSSSIKKIRCNAVGDKVFAILENTSFFYSTNYGETWTIDDQNIVPYSMSNSYNGGLILVGGYSSVVSLGLLSSGGLIKSISRVPLASISVVSGVPIENLDKIAGEQN